MPSSNHPHPEERPQGASRRTHASDTSDLTLQWHGWAEFTVPLLYELLRFRQAIFVVEQASPYPDLDGHDLEAQHLLLRRGEELIGCLRLIAPDPLVRIGRVGVAAGDRGRGFARAMMQAALERAAQVHPHRDDDHHRAGPSARRRQRRRLGERLLVLRPPVARCAWGRRPWLPAASGLGPPRRRCDGSPSSSRGF